MSKKYSILSFLLLAVSITFVFTVLNSKVFGSFGDTSTATPLVVALVLNVASVILSIKSWRSGGNKGLVLSLILLALFPVALILIGAAAAGGH